ncbi:uncharacterized protein LOC144761695 [Lissotriton helveticus]
MSEMLKGIKGLSVFQDDVLIFAPDNATHDKILNEVLSRFQENGEVLRRDKCVFRVKEVEYLGHLVNENGIFPKFLLVSSLRLFLKCHLEFTLHLFSTPQRISVLCYIKVCIFPTGIDIILTAFKDCLDPSQKAACGRELSFKRSESSLWTSRVCCDSDFCNSGDVKLPPSDNTPNGYICKDCFNDQSADPCTATGVVQCSRMQNACVSYFGTVSRPGVAGRPYSGKGCSTRDFCKLGFFNLAGVQAYDYGLKCTPALKV